MRVVDVGAAIDPRARAILGEGRPPLVEASDDYPTPTHRIALEFWWGRSAPPLVVIGMNPSRASRHRGDATVLRCARRAWLLGCGGLVMLNAHSFHATDPADLWRAPVREEQERLNLEAIDRALADHPSAPVLFAPGGDRHPRHRARIDEIVAIARARSRPLLCLGTTRDGTPRHPLYCPYDTALVPWPRTAGLVGDAARADTPAPATRPEM